MQTIQTIEVSNETPKVLESIFIAFQYSDLCSSLTDRERGFYFEEYLNLQKLIKHQIESRDTQY